MPDLLNPAEQLAALRLLEHGLSVAIREAADAADDYRRAARAKQLETDWGLLSLTRTKETITLEDVQLLEWAAANAPHLITQTISTAAKAALKARCEIVDGDVIDTETGETLTFATVKPGREGLTVRLAPEAKAWAEAAVVGGYADLADAFAGFLAAHPMELEA